MRYADKFVDLGLKFKVSSFMKFIMKVLNEESFQYIGCLPLV